VGQVIGFLVAHDRLVAERAAKLVRVDVEEMAPSILSIEDAIDHKSFYKERVIQSGDADGVFLSAAHVLEGEMRVGGQEHFYMETQSCLVIPKEEDEMEVHLSTQAPSSMQREVALCLGIPANRVEVKTRRCGGAFGGKSRRCAHVAMSCAIAASEYVRIISRHFKG